MTTQRVTIEFDPPLGPMRLRKLVVPNALVENLAISRDYDLHESWRGGRVSVAQPTSFDLTFHGHEYTIHADDPNGTWIDGEVIDETETRALLPRPKAIGSR